jgi:uncharacterized protein (TIGR03435 family)
MDYNVTVFAPAINVRRAAVNSTRTIAGDIGGFAMNISSMMPQKKLATLALFTVCLSAQQFDVVSVKPSATPQREGSCRLPKVDPVRLTTSGCTLRSLIRWAYDLKPSDFSEGGPAWIDAPEARFDIDASSDTPAAASEMRLKFETLLADRFQLKVRKEKQSRPGYGLITAKGGSKVAEVAGDPVLNGRIRFSMDGKAMLLTGSKASMTELALWATSLASDGTVVDETALTKVYDFKLVWTPAEVGRASSLSAAFQEQLGLRLEPKKVPADVLIVEKAERPTANR